MQPITTDEIIEACQVHTPELVKEIWARAQERASYELDRQKLLDGKATSLLQAVGLSLTLAIGLGCQVLLGKHNPLATLDSWHTVALVAALILAVCCALGSSILATRALGVRFDYERLTERGVFNKDELAAADGKAFVKVGPDEEFKLSNPLAAVATYQRYLLPAIWALAQ